MFFSTLLVLFIVFFCFFFWCDVDVGNVDVDFGNPSWVLGLPYQEGYPTCLVKALLGITRLPPSCVTINSVNLKGIIQFLSLIIDIWKIKSYFLSTMIIFSLFFVKKNFKIISNLGRLQRMSRMTKHVSKAKADPGDRVALPVKFACKPELPLTRLLG